MPTNTDTPSVLAELQQLVEANVITWSAIEFKHDGSEVDSAQGYHGAVPDWSITVVCFERNGQVGYDGAAAAFRQFTVVHLTPELAKAMVDQAVARTKE
jgi:hypothetical protein